MPKRNYVTATYRLNDSELIQVTVKATSPYPDALQEATTRARRLVRDMLTDVLELTRETEAK